jgi:hypothetical protein
MLEWIQVSEKCHDLYSGKLWVASIQAIKSYGVYSVFIDGVYDIAHGNSDSLEAAKVAAESAFREWLDKASLPPGDYSDGYRAGIEAAAQLIEGFVVVSGRTAIEGESPLVPRDDGDISNLGYADGIRRLTKGEGNA